MSFPVPLNSPVISRTRWLAGSRVSPLRESTNTRHGSVKRTPTKVAKVKVQRVSHARAISYARPRSSAAQQRPTPVPLKVANWLACTPGNSAPLHAEHLSKVFQSLELTRKLPRLDPTELHAKRVHLPKKGKKTIVFDLDETLVHCVHQEKGDLALALGVTSGKLGKTGVNVRPYAKECLQEASKLFEVIVFTAACKEYADAVLNQLDPTRTLIHHRLYRDHCVQVQGCYVKDLRILIGRRFQDTVIVDNSLVSFAYQLENGVPIHSWHDDYSDCQLLELVDYMKVLHKSTDVREMNRKTFPLQRFYQEYLETSRKSTAA